MIKFIIFAVLAIIFAILTIQPAQRLIQSNENVKKAEKELLESTKELNRAGVDLLNVCYTGLTIGFQEAAGETCNSGIMKVKQECINRTNKIVLQNMPVCNDPRIDEYIKTRGLK